MNTLSRLLIVLAAFSSPWIAIDIRAGGPAPGNPTSAGSLLGTAQIRGTVWIDADGNGQRDSGEVGASGWTLFLDANLNGVLDPEETFVLSDPQGQFSFTNLAAGVHTVAEFLPALWRQTFPTAGFGQRIMPTFGSAQLIQASGVNLKVSSYSAPAVADWDHDGKLDLIIGEEDGSLGKVRVYLNQGSPTSPAFGAYFYAQSMGVPLTVPAMGCLGAFPRVVDWDQDGRKDLLVGLANGAVQIFMNTNTDADPQFGAGAAVKFGPLGAKADIDVGARATLELVDWNNDGVVDLVVGALDGKVRVFLNEARTGTPDLRSVVTVKDGAADLTVPTSRASVAVTDLNGDGRKDLILGNTAGELYLYPNVGTDADPRFSGSQRIQAGGVPISLGVQRSRPCVLDFDGDGVIDLVVGGADGLVRFFKGSISSAGGAAALAAQTAAVPRLCVPQVVSLTAGASATNVDFGNQLLSSALPPKPLARGTDQTPDPNVAATAPSAPQTTGPGDITVTVLNMDNGALSNPSSARVTLMGVDDRGYRTLAVNAVNSAGTTTFGAPAIQTTIHGDLHFVVDASAGTNGFRTRLHDPFGFAHTYIRYQTNGQYRFALPVIEQGVCQPDVLWTGSQSVLSFSVDLGDRDATDFWFTRLLVQKKSSDAQWVGTEVGLVPLVSSSWLRAKGYALDDHGMTNGQIAPLRLTGPGYDQTFLGRKLDGSGDSDPRYEIELLNGAWRNDLVGSYDPIRRIYAMSFDPTTVFSDTNAPGWDGSAMKAGEVYFATLQAEAWIWHSAGVSNGLALEWGSGAAAALAHPIRINDQRIWVEWLNSTPLAPSLRVHGNAGLGYTLECSTNLAAAAWFAVATTNASTSPFEWMAPVPTAGHRFYRVRQP